MDSDEGMYIAFWPKKMKKQLIELEDLVMTSRHHPTFQGLNVTAITKFLAVILMLAAVIPMYIMPQVRALHASSPSCSGHVFVL